MFIVYKSEYKKMYLSVLYVAEKIQGWKKSWFKKKTKKSWFFYL